MFSIILILALISLVNSNTVCERCACLYDSKSDVDYQGEIVDCSYRKNLLSQGYVLPNTVHSLDLSSSNITRVKSCTLLQSNTMKNLLLNNNAITSITTDAFGLPNLLKLDLSDNLLEYIEEDTFRNINNLEYLNLANNRFTTFKQFTFHPLSNLQEIILDNNKIGPDLKQSNLFDRSGFGLTKNIKNLSISGIGLDEVPDNFFVDPYDIRKIVISNNGLKSVFELPGTLEYLDLSDNPIEDIESEDFADVPFLKVLKLNNLAITEVPPFTFHYLTSLKDLELERNKNLTEFDHLAFGREIYHLPMDFFLESLSLKGSRLTELNEDLLQLFGLLTHLDLQGNPWKCDCNIVWLKELQIEEKYYDHLRCATPKPLFNARIFDLDRKYFLCPPNRHVVGLTITVISISVTLAAAAVWLFVFVPRRHQRSNWLRMMYTPSTAYTMLPVPHSVIDS